MTTGGPAFNQRNRRWMAAGAGLLLWPLLVLTLVACALNYDIWQKELTIAGPFAFATSPPRHSLLVPVPPEYTSVWWSKSLLADDVDHPDRSGVELWINGRKMLPPHTAQETIGEGTNTGFRHWGSNVIFSLPAGVENAAEAKVKLRYKAPPPSWVTFGLASCSALLAWFSYRRRITSFERRHREAITPFVRRCGERLTIVMLRVVRYRKTFTQRDLVWIAAGASLLFWPLLLLTLVAHGLSFDIWEKELAIAGPFASATSPPRHSLLVPVPPESSVWWGKLLADDVDHPYQSRVELWINGRNMLPPHTIHEAISEGTTTGFSHWGSGVIFSLPAGVENSPETRIKLRYKIPPPPWVTFALTISCLLLALPSYYLRAIEPLPRRPGRHVITLLPGLLRAPIWTLLGLLCVLLMGSAAFILSTLYALATGWAFPTTALLRWSPIARWAAMNEPYLGQLLLILAGFGAATTWLASLSSELRDVVKSDELRVRQILLWCGYPIAACALVFSTSAMWSGIVRPGDINSNSIGGLIPFFDAFTYLAAAYDQARDGSWNTVAAHRPLAAAFRSVLLFFGDYSLQRMLILQACLLAAAACFAAHAVIIWRGVWAGLAFFGLTYIYVRTFTPTVLTEPQGLFWALLSIPFFIESFRSGKAKPALVGFAMTVVALMTRMGSMFTIPALLLWLVWQFGQTSAAKLRIGIASICILLGIFGLTVLLQNAFGTGTISSDGNFAYVICGLTMGTTWQGCITKLGSTIQPDDAALFKQLYALAWDNFRAHPDVLFERLAAGPEIFVRNFQVVIWGGYTGIEPADWLWQGFLTALSLIGLLYVVVRRATRVELAFWILFWAGIFLSVPFFYFEDGARTMAASHPLIALFFTMGITSPAPAPKEVVSDGGLSRYGSAILLLAAILFVGVPWLAHRFSPVEAQAANFQAKQNEAFVFGGRRMSGFLVVENGQPLRNDVPTLHLADFEDIIQQSGVEEIQGLLHPVMPQLPFGFVYAPRLEKGVLSYRQFIVPAEVVEHRDVPAWHFQIAQWRKKPTDSGDYWFLVTKAEPWGEQSQHR